ncbi:SDR family oxidoreductase [Mucilaginibacter defluvii]|uniref:SDR family oxidoreductase n=1 Tax=Mucilaginibacter defluvii TaxID=1196019 RepID=A0ABP9G2A6_9SPHI
MRKIVLLTGASSGIGLACANKLSQEGYRVYGSSREVESLQDVHFRPIELNVTDDRSVSEACDYILDIEGRIDILINNAGNGVAGPAYQMPIALAKKQFEVNFFGAVRMCNAVLPGMIARNEGLIVNIGSLAGLFGLPYQSMYSASKFAIEGFSQSLRMELRNTGVNVTVINPGDFRSSFSQNRDKCSFSIKNENLQQEYEAALKSMERDEMIAPYPDQLAERLLQILNAEKPKHRYLVGQLGQTIVPTLKRVLPCSVFEKLMNRHYGIK